MNNFIKFYIISFLIGLNSSLIIYVKINKKGLKSEPKNFEDKDCPFRVKLAKWSANGEWEYASEEKFIKTNNVPASLELLEEWNNLFNFERSRHYYYKKIRPRREPFWLAVKVEMVDNKLVYQFMNF